MESVKYDGSSLEPTEDASSAIQTVLLSAGIEIAALQELRDNAPFAKLVAQLANNAFEYLSPVKEAESVPLVAEEPVTLDTSVAYLCLDRTTWCALTYAGYNTVRSLMFRTEADLRKLRGIGPRKADWINRRLKEFGFSLLEPGTLFWDAITRSYGSIASAPIDALFEGGIVYDRPRNRKLLSSAATIGDLSLWTHREIYKVSGDPNQNGRQDLYSFLREHGIPVE